MTTQPSERARELVRQIRQRVQDGRCNLAQVGTSLFGTYDQDDVSFLLDALDAQAKVIEGLRSALKPFASFAADNVDDEGWAKTRCQNERIVDWFGPSDFRTARQAIKDSLDGSQGGER